MYEVKSKAAPEKVGRKFKFNNISAGSFERFCHLYNSPKKPDQKMFMVILPREHTLNRAREEVHPVYIAEIDIAKPKLCETTLNTEEGSIRLHTNVNLKLYAKTRWFDLPRRDFVDIKAMKKKVFVDIFGMECWKGLKGESPVEESTNDYDLQAEFEKFGLQGKNWDNDGSNSESE